MSTKIPLSRIAELTAAATGESQPTTLRFIKDLFSIVEDEVSKGNDVAIEGLGVFSGSDIPGEPVSFRSDDEYAARLNEAFAMFSPVELNTEVTEEQLAEADADEPKEDDVEKREEVTAQSDENVNEVPDASEDVPAKVPDDIIRESIEIVELPAIPDKSDSVKVDETEPETNEPTTETILESTETILEETPQIPKDNSENYIPEDEEEYVVVRKSGSKFFIGLLLGLIVGFACGVIAFLLYIVRTLNVQVEDVFPF